MRPPGGALVPLLTLGIPSSATVAILMGALMMNGLRPGPLLMAENPEFFWGLVASMYVGNVMLLVLNLPLIGLWIKILKVPYPVLIPLILLFVQLGAYTVGGAIVGPVDHVRLRPGRLPDEEVRLPGRAVGAGPGAWADHGEEPEALPDHLPG